MLYKAVRPLIKVFVLIVFRPKYIGLENIPKNGSIILAGNHTSIFDPLLLISSTNKVIHFLAKDSLYKGIKKPLFKNMAIIPVNRSIKDKRPLTEAKKLLEYDKVIGIFPEGTINRTNDVIMPFKMGTIKLASDTGAPVVPFVIKGKYRLMGGISIKFLKPYKVLDTDLESENKVFMHKISTLLERN